MWLLRISEASQPALEWKDSSEGFRYAILSHTWEHGHELTFQEFQRGLGKEKSGYTKIVKACAQALGDGLKYIWVDTVCINKESSAELTEAINSMWKWYCDAEVCYTILTDVDSECPELEDIEDDWSINAMYEPEGQVAWAKEFAASRWFKRGWTLQELLASENLVFFNAAWQQIGTKASLINGLHAITGIDKLALEVRESIPSFVIARKMCWAANRETTRTEDRAYSLLGIFGINMPMLYGEGENAFIRFQEELIRNSTDQSIFAWEWTKGMQPSLHNDLLLATSPDQFYPKGQRMIYWLGNISDSPFHLTNRGIDFQGISLQPKEECDTPASATNAAWVVLNCRDENDAGALALCVVQQDQHTADVDSSLLMKNKAYWVAWEPDVPRLNPWKMDIPIPRRVTLLRKHFASAWGAKLTPRFRIGLEPGLLQTFTFTKGWPPRLWQEGLDTMSLPRQSNYPEYVTASVSIRFKGYGSGSFLHVAFCFSPLDVDQGPTVALSRLSQEAARHELFHDGPYIPESKRLKEPKDNCERAASEASWSDASESKAEDSESASPEPARSGPTATGHKSPCPKRKRPKHAVPKHPRNSTSTFDSLFEKEDCEHIQVVDYTRLEDCNSDQLVCSAKLMHVQGNPEHSSYTIEVLWAGSVPELDAKEKEQEELRREERISWEREGLFGATYMARADTMGDDE